MSQFRTQLTATAASLYDVKTTDSIFASSLQDARKADFLVWDEAFLNILGPTAKIEKIQTFPEEEQRVHEAPVYLPETNELLYSDTDITGWLWVVNIDTHEVCSMSWDLCNATLTSRRLVRWRRTLRCTMSTAVPTMMATSIL